MNLWNRVTLPLLITLAACDSGGPPMPALLDTRNERCRFCQMTVSSVATAAQIVVQGEEPIFFDDLGCLSTWLKQDEGLAADAIVYVADHRTGRWVTADNALFTRVQSLDTPMGSRIVAHADAASRDADPLARAGATVPAADILGERETAADSP